MIATACRCSLSITANGRGYEIVAEYEARTFRTAQRLKINECKNDYTANIGNEMYIPLNNMANVDLKNETPTFVNVLLAEVKAGTHKQFILNTEKERVECRCGHVAIWFN